MYAARHEYCETATDFLLRRTRLAFVDIDAAEAALPRVRWESTFDAYPMQWPLCRVRNLPAVVMRSHSNPADAVTARHICYSICERLRLEASVCTAWSFRMSAYCPATPSTESSLRFSKQTCFLLKPGLCADLMAPLRTGGGAAGQGEGLGLVAQAVRDAAGQAAAGHLPRQPPAAGRPRRQVGSAFRLCWRLTRELMPASCAVHCF